MKVDVVPERGDAMIATAARASLNRRADQYTDEQNEGLQRQLLCFSYLEPKLKVFELFSLKGFTN